MPLRVAPMLATRGDVSRVGPDYSLEFKLDGQRAMAVADGRGVRLSSRNGSSITRTYPEIVDDLRAAIHGRSAILDGEVVALDADGRPSFALLQRRMHAQRPSAALVREVRAALFVFDVLALDGQNVTQWPYVARRELLEGLGLSSARVAVSPSFTAADGVDGAAMLELARVNGQEGVVAKLLRSRYRPGERSPDWIKQPLREVATVLVCGWIGTDTRLESLLLAAPHPEGGVRYLGDVGTGFSVADRRDLLRLLVVRERTDHPLDTAPPHSRVDARWVQPDLVGEVHYREFTGRLRHASWRGLRVDVDAAAAQWPT